MELLFDQSRNILLTRPVIISDILRIFQNSEWFLTVFFSTPSSYLLSSLQFDFNFQDNMIISSLIINDTNDRLLIFDGTVR